MAHDEEPYYKHLDTIECEEEHDCRHVTHEPISVTGPTDDSRVIQPRFGDDVGKPTTASYPYEEQLDLESETCEIEVCIRSGTFQTKGAPLQVGFNATPIEEPGGDCRFVVRYAVILNGSERYIGFGIVPPSIAFEIEEPSNPFGNNVGNCPAGFTWDGSSCVATSDTIGFSPSAARSDAVQTNILNPCPAFDGLGPSLVIATQGIFDPQALVGQGSSDTFFPLAFFVSSTRTVTTTYYSLTCPITSPGDATENCTNTTAIFQVTTDLLCTLQPATSVASVTGIIQAIDWMRTDAPFPVTNANWDEALTNWSPCA